MAATMREKLQKVVLALRIAAVLAVCQLAAILAPLRASWALLTGNQTVAWEIAKAYDRLGNATLNGSSTETISSRAARARRENRRWGCVLCSILDAIQKGHCKNSEGV